VLAMRAYELMVIVDAEVDDPGVQAVIEQVKEQIALRSGDVKKTDLWGRRRFAYEIDHKHEGSYVVSEVLAEAGALDDLERQLRLADDIVRHKLIRLPDAEAARRGMAVNAA
jgi:small subunit ribosomal protein S6